MPDLGSRQQGKPRRVYKVRLKLIQMVPQAASSKRNRGATTRDHPFDYFSVLKIDVADLERETETAGLKNRRGRGLELIGFLFIHTCLNLVDGENEDRGSALSKGH